MAEERNNRKIKTGIVVSDKADKTITVNVKRQVVQPKYEKIISLSKKYKEKKKKNESHIGDTVRIMETRPL
jgi:small subunit ribosomal protein S17